jgi:hypothetical protein
LILMMTAADNFSVDRSGCPMYLDSGIRLFRHYPKQSSFPRCLYTPTMDRSRIHRGPRIHDIQTAYFQPGRKAEPTMESVFGYTRTTKNSRFSKLPSTSSPYHLLISSSSAADISLHLSKHPNPHSATPVPTFQGVRRNISD